jgi:pimeloyl-ACP methyl ester carboxylesterase
MENIVQDWWLSAIDILFLVQELRLREGAKRIVGIGHSIGGAVLLMAALLSPQIFEELITMEPIIRPPPYTLEDNPLSLQAKKRRFQFDTKEEAYHYYKQKKDLFGMWNDRVLRAYIDGGIRWYFLEIINSSFDHYPLAFSHVIKLSHSFPSPSDSLFFIRILLSVFPLYGFVQKFPQGNSKNRGRLNIIIVFVMLIIVRILVCDFFVTLLRGSGQPIFLEGNFGFTHIYSQSYCFTRSIYASNSYVVIH